MGYLGLPKSDLTTPVRTRYLVLPIGNAATAGRVFSSCPVKGLKEALLRPSIFYYRNSLVLFIHSGHFYIASSSPLLLRSAPDTARKLCRSFTAKRHSQL